MCGIHELEWKFHRFSYQLSPIYRLPYRRAMQRTMQIDGIAMQLI